MRRLGLVFLLALGLVAVFAAAPSVLPGPPAATAHPEPGDIDGDGVRDENDNCPQTANGDQRDTDGDRVGDRCDEDADADGVKNSTPYLDRGDDNCPLTKNPGQEDDGPEGTPGDGIGDACDVDLDGDRVTDARDNCPGLTNPDQTDSPDRDKVGNPCDPDDDEDGEFDNADNCPLEYNPLQEDGDGDGIGFWCDPVEPTGDGGGGGGGGSGGDSGGGRDTTAPALRLVLARTQRLRELGRSLPVEVRCDEGCSVRASLTVKRTTARKLRIRSRTLASGTAKLGDAGTTYVFMRFKRGTVRRLARARTVRAQLTVTGADSAGNRRDADRPVRIRR